MKKIFSLVILALFVSPLWAQFDPRSPIDEPDNFKDKSYNFFLSKRLKRAIHQRDSLNELVIAFNRDTTQRGIEYRYLDSLYRALMARYTECGENNNTLKQQFAELNARYNDLMKKSLSDAERFNNALKLKAEELEAREKRLAELQGIINAQDSLLNALNDVVKKALLSFKSDEISVEMKNGKVYISMSDKLLFKSGSAALEDAGKEAIKKLADVLNKNPDIDVLIEGHTDNIPIKTARYEDNWSLSADRALSIVRLLSEAHDVNPKRLVAAGRGEFYPKADNATAEGRAKNRRTEIILTPKLDELYKLIQKNRRN
ncbi:MAG: flagellar motor protein MotB [Bacteroidota bacterium]|jgi:chemotaxis protein MotB